MAQNDSAIQTGIGNSRGLTDKNSCLARNPADILKVAGVLADNKIDT